MDDFLGADYLGWIELGVGTVYINTFRAAERYIGKMAQSSKRRDLPDDKEVFTLSREMPLR